MANLRTAIRASLRSCSINNLCAHCPVPHLQPTSGPSLTRQLSTSHTSSASPRVGLLFQPVGRIDPEKEDKQPNPRPKTSSPRPGRGQQDPSPRRPFRTLEHSNPGSRPQLQRSRHEDIGRISGAQINQRRSQLYPGRITSEDDALRNSDRRSINVHSARSGMTTSLQPAKAIVRPVVDPSRHLGALTEFNNLPPYAKLEGMEHNRKIGYTSIDMQEVLPIISTSKSATHNSPYYLLRAYPNRLLPPRKPPPFPAQYLKQRKEPSLLRMACVTSKARLGKSAVIRNRARRRVKAALDMVVNRGVALSTTEDGWDMVDPELTYVFYVNEGALEAPMEALCEAVKTSLRGILKSQAKTSGTRPTQNRPRDFTGSAR